MIKDLQNEILDADGVKPNSGSSKFITNRNIILIAMWNKVIK